MLHSIPIGLCVCVHVCVCVCVCDGGCVCVQGWMCVHVHVRVDVCETYGWVHVSIYYSGLHINPNKTSP